LDFLTHLFDTSDFPERWKCGRWTEGHGWLHIASDLGVWSAYLAIPCVLLFFFLRRNDLPFRKVFLLFGAFILLCGATHLMEAIIFWWPAYRLAGVLKLCTAIVSWGTVFALIPIVPKVLALRSPEELEREIVARKQAEEALQRINTDLEQRVEERSAELKQALEEIRNERELLKTTLVSIGEGLITTDAEGRVTNLNPVAEALTGWTTLEALGQPLTNVFQIINETTRQPVRNPVFKAIQEGVIVGLANHTLLIHKDGTECPIDDSAAPIRGADLVIKGCVLVFRDITERKRVEDALRESEARFRRMFESNVVGMIRWDLDRSLILDANDTFLQMTGYTREDVAAGRLNFRDMTPAEWTSRNDEGVRTIRANGHAAPYEKEYFHKDGSRVPLIIAGTRFADSPSEGMSLIIDISDRKRVEATLVKSEAEYRAIFEQSAVGKAQVCAKTGRFVRVNAKYCELTGYSAEELVGMSPADLDFAEDREADAIAVGQFYRGEVATYEAEKRSVRKDGKVIWIHVSATLLRDADGQPDRTMAVIQDVTARKQAELELQESQQQFHTLVDAMPQLAWIAHPDGFIHWYNQRWYTYTGTTPEQMEGWGWQSVHDPAVLPQVLEEFHASIATVEPFEKTFPLRGADGVMRPFLTRMIPLKDDQGRLLKWFGTNTDVSVLKDVVDSLRISEEFSRTVLESSPDCVKVMDGEGRLQYLNTNGQSLLEIDDFALYEGQYWWKLWPTADQDMVRDAVGRAQRGENVSFQALGPTTKGNLKWWDVVVGPGAGRDAAGHATRLISVSRDITDRKQAEEALRQSAELFTRLVDQAPTGTYVVDAEFRMQQINALAAPVFGEVHPLIGRDFAEIIQILWGPEVGGQIADIFRHTLASGEHYISPRFVERRSDIGVEQAYDWETQRVTLADGKYGVVCYFQDITERQRTEQALRDSETLTRLATEATAVGIWEWNVLTNAIRWDAQLFRIYGIEPTQNGFVDYSDWSRAVLPEDLLENEQILQDTVRNCGNSRRDFRILRRSDGEQRDIQAVETVRTNAQGQAEWVVGTNLDVTTRKRLEEDLRVTAAELSEADHRKDEFLAMLAHELRNPLAPVRTGLEVLRLHGGSSREIQKATSMMTRQIEQMVRLVDDLLDVSRISTGKIELRKERVELATIIELASEAARPQCESRRHQLTVSQPPQPIFLQADSARLVQVVGNLLTNACKFTNDGGQISLTVQSVGGSDSGLPEEAIIRVRDNGIGIRADQMPRVFQMFVQLDSSLEKSVSGLGIGLALVKNLVEMHNGNVEVHSDGIGQGSEFVIHLPVIQDTPASGSASPTPSIEGKQSAPLMRVLVVDDNVDAADALEMLLQMTGYETQTANDGLQAVEAARTFHPDVVLLDIGLPKLNGHEVARHIRAQPWGQNMVLVALTGWGQDADRQRTLAAGFNAHLVKPVNLQVLEQMLEDIGQGKPI